MDRWMEVPVRMIKEALPTTLWPTCVRRKLLAKPAVREEEKIVTTLASTRDPAPTPRVSKPAKEIAGPSTPTSQKTTSTISERVKMKYLKLKSDMKKWANRGRPDDPGQTTLKTSKPYRPNSRPSNPTPGPDRSPSKKVCVVRIKLIQ